MSSYNKINGEFAQESYSLLTDILRNDWGFKGMVMTDWTGLRNTAAQVHAGNDLMEPGYDSQIEDIIKSVKSGKLKESDMDICVRRILELCVRSPKMHGVAFSNKPDLKAHAQVTRQSAAEGMVLLKNSGVLPLHNINKVALFGVNSYDFLHCGCGSGNVNVPYVIDMVQGLKNAGIGGGSNNFIGLTSTDGSHFNQNFQNKSGTIALTSDIKVVPEVKIGYSDINVPTDCTLFKIDIGRNVKSVINATVEKHYGSASGCTLIDGCFWENTDIDIFQSTKHPNSTFFIRKACGTMAIEDGIKYSLKVVYI